MAEISRLLNSEESLCVLDLGSTSANNIRFLTAKGHKNYSEDLLQASLDPALRVKDETGKLVPDSKKFLDENLTYANGLFDVVLCWNLPDYMEESLVKPTIDRLWSVMKPGGLLLVFFHTRDAGPDAPCYRFHMQRVFNNRNIENLFRDFASIKFFLARDAIREVLLVR